MDMILKPFILTLSLVGYLFLTSCATLTDDIETEVHFDPATDFNAYKSYAWLGSAQIVFDPIGQWEQPTLDTDEEVKFNINQQLRQHGLYPVSSEPDFYVAFSAGIDMTSLELVQDPEAEQDVLQPVPKAALMVALIDAETGYTVWLGYAEGEVQDQQTIENIRARIRYAVSEIFKSYNE